MVKYKIRWLVEKWVKDLLKSEFFDSCEDHEDQKKNEKNLFCIDCSLQLCKHCVIISSSNPNPNDDYSCLHGHLLQICKYVYHNVVRINDIQLHLDCSLIQAYKINGEKAVHLNPRPPQKDAKSTKSKCGGTYCQTCGRHIQDLPNRFCSIACKVLPSIKGLDNVDGVPNLKPSSCNVSSPSLTDSSSEVIQAWCRPKKRLRKRKGFPRRAPFY